MSPTEIEAGARYYNAKGHIRQVTRFANSRKGKGETDRVEYTVISGPAQGKTYECTTKAFAKWAAGRAPDRQDEGEGPEAL